jgi:hypothetical protein
MQLVSVTIGGVDVGLFVDDEVETLLDRRTPVRPNEDGRADYVVGSGNQSIEGGGVREPVRLDHGTCRVLRHDDRGLLVDAFFSHVRNLMSVRGDSAQYLGAALTRDELAVPVPVEVLSSAAGLVNTLAQAGWQIHPGSRIGLRAGEVELIGSQDGGHDLLAPAGRRALGGLVLDRRFGTGETSVDVIGLILRSLDQAPELDADEAIDLAIDIEASDIPILVERASSPRTIVDWVNALEG